MSAALPSLEENCCPILCEDVVVQNIPGPKGDNGTDGTDGADGTSAITTLTVAFTMPAELASDTATMATTAGLVIGENVFVQSLGTLQVTGIPNATQATLKNLEDSGTGVYSENAAAGTIAPVGSRVGPTGLQGVSGLLSGAAAGGDLKGNYPNPKLSLPNTLGALVVGNGTDANALAAGTDGQIPAYDSTQPLGMIPKSLIPVTGDINVATDRLTRLSAGAGTPIPIEASRASLKDPGGAGLFVADATGGNARGVDAVDLQVNRTGPGSVASGLQSVIAGGQKNTASGIRSVVVGGTTNHAAGTESFIGSGEANTVDSTQSVVVGGDANGITGGSANESVIAGGAHNSITGAGQATIAGGYSNSVSSQYGSVLGGFTNGVSADYGVIAGGSTNIVSGQYASVLGGGSNTASGFSASIIGGSGALADKYGQRAFAAGRFAAQGDAQQTDLVWRIQTTGIVAASEMFLDGNSLRATIAANRTVAFDILITARSNAGLNAAWTVKGVINNLAGSTTISTAVINALIADNSGATFGTLANVPVVSADDVNDALVIKVSNPAATNVRWVAHGRLVEISF